MRQTGVEVVHAIVNDEDTRVPPQTHASFLRGVDLYSRRPDRDYSLVDCISMNVMRDEGITDILTNDHHFAQEGFHILVRKP